jgi:hypothetical protein
MNSPQEFKMNGPAVLKDKYFVHRFVNYKLAHLDPYRGNALKQEDRKGLSAVV